MLRLVQPYHSDFSIVCITSLYLTLICLLSILIHPAKLSDLLWPVSAWSVELYIALSQCVSILQSGNINQVYTVHTLLFILFLSNPLFSDSYTQIQSIFTFTLFGSNSLL